MNRSGLSSTENLVIALVLSACSIAYELLLANTLAIMTGSYIWWQSLTIGVYIGGLGAGAAWAERFKNPINGLLRAELVLTFLGGISVVYIYFFHGGYLSSDFLFYIQNDYSSPAYFQYNLVLKSIFIFFIQGLTFLIGLFSGLEIPLLIKLHERAKGVGKTYQILGLSYLGTLLGSLVFAFVLIPNLNVIAVSLYVATTNFFVCLYILFRSRFTTSVFRLASASLVALVLLLVAHYSHQIEQVYLKTHYLFKTEVTKPGARPLDFFKKLSEFHPVERLKSMYQYIDIYRPDTKDQETILAIDMNFQFSSFNERYYHEAFSHIPISMTQKVPRQVLVLGGGDGLLLRELLKYPSIESITHIELDEKILEISKEREVFAKLNEGSLKHPKVHTLTEDAFYFLRNQTQKFDAIFIDFPYPNNYDLARLYSLEFYTYVHKALAEDGFVTLDAPIHDRRVEIPTHEWGQVVVDTVFRPEDKISNSILLSTAHFAGFSSLFPYKVNHESFLLMTKHQTDYNYEIDELSGDKYQKIRPKHLREVMRLTYPYEIKRSYVNSIFRPRLLQRPKL